MRLNEGANPPSSWALAPAPSGITVVPGSVPAVRLEWTNKAIANRWLQVQVLPNANTGLGQRQTFYMGNLQGEMDFAVNAGAFEVTSNDHHGRASGRSACTVDSRRDVDKNGFIVNADFIQIRAAISAAAKLTQITIPAAGSSNEAPSLPPEPQFVPLVTSGSTTSSSTTSSSTTSSSTTSNSTAPGVERYGWFLDGRCETNEPTC